MCGGPGVTDIAGFAGEVVGFAMSPVALGGWREVYAGAAGLSGFFRRSIVGSVALRCRLGP
ncbi:hypothetical protein CMI47_20320 [Candidatus Pacearchaeota archaeon]|nr:hypothetical protein [Candidatus Pacearchaeota archaeon]